MIRYELKKVINRKAILCLGVINLLFLALFWIQVRGVKQAQSTEVLQSIYHKVGGEITEEKAEQIENLKGKMDEIMGAEGTVEQKYREGKLTIDEYMKYRDEFHYMKNRSDAIDNIYERYQTNRKQGGWMIFDRYYEKLFQPERDQWGLILSAFLLMCLLVTCETPELSCVICVTKKGKRGVRQEKLRAMAVFSVIFTLLYAVEECAVIFVFSRFPYMEAPVQSVSCLADVTIPVNIGQWYFITLLLRVFHMVLFSVAGSVLLLHIKNKRMGIFAIACIIFAPMILARMTSWDACNVVSRWISVYPLFLRM